MARRKGFAVRLGPTSWFILRACAALVAQEEDGPDDLAALVERFPPVGAVFGQKTLRFSATHVSTMKRVLEIAVAGMVHKGYSASSPPTSHGSARPLQAALDKLSDLHLIDLLGDVSRTQLVSV